jgi:hypothetical protein
MTTSTITQLHGFPFFHLLHWIKPLPRQQHTLCWTCEDRARFSYDYYFDPYPFAEAQDRSILERSLADARNEQRRGQFHCYERAYTCLACVDTSLRGFGDGSIYDEVAPHLAVEFAGRSIALGTIVQSADVVVGDPFGVVTNETTIESLVVNLQTKPSASSILSKPQNYQPRNGKKNLAT